MCCFESVQVTTYKWAFQNKLTDHLPKADMSSYCGLVGNISKIYFDTWKNNGNQRTFPLQINNKFIHFVSREY